METRKTKPGRPRLGNARRKRLSMTLKPELVKWIESRASARGMSTSRVAESLLEWGKHDSSVTRSLWEARLGMSLERLKAFCEALGITRLGLFGSVIRDDFRPDSDIDLLVEYDDKKVQSLLDVGGIQMTLSETLGRSVDLVQLENVTNPYRRRHIEQNMEWVYESK